MKNTAEQHYTPKEVIQSLTKNVLIEGKLFEPCVGSGMIVNTIPGNWTTNDLFKSQHYNANLNRDMTLPESWKDLDIDFTITNPPFSKAVPILKNALEYSKVGVAFLTRITFLEPCKNRVDIFQTNPPSQIIFLNRTRFKEESGKIGYDMASHCWLVWYKNMPSNNLKFEVNKTFSWE